MYKKSFQIITKRKKNNVLSNSIINDEKKIDFIISKQIAWYFVQYSECLSNLPSNLLNSNNKPFSYFKDLRQSQ